MTAGGGGGSPGDSDLVRTLSHPVQTGSCSQAVSRLEMTEPKATAAGHYYPEYMSPFFFCHVVRMTTTNSSGLFFSRSRRRCV